MNEHVNDSKELVDNVLEVAHRADDRDGVVHYQDDSDYFVDPLDRPDFSPAPGKAATEEREGVERNDLCEVHLV